MSRHADAVLLSTYLDGELDAGAKERVESHLEDCDPCRRKLAGLRRAVEALAGLEASHVPADLAARVERRIGEAVATEPLGARAERALGGRPALPVWAPAFAVVLAMGLILYLFSEGLHRSERTSFQVVFEDEPLADANATADTTDTAGDQRQEIALVDTAMRGRQKAEARAGAPDKAASLTEPSEPSEPSKQAEPVTSSVAVPEAVASLVRKDDAALVAPARETVPQAATVSGAPSSATESQPAAASASSALAEAAPEEATRALVEESGARRAREFQAAAVERRQAAGRTFDLRSGVWVEVGLDPGVEPEERLVWGSSAADRLVEETPQLAELVSLDAAVRLRIGERVVEFTPSALGPERSEPDR